MPRSISFVHARNGSRSLAISFEIAEFRAPAGVSEAGFTAYRPVSKPAIAALLVGSISAVAIEQPSPDRYSLTYYEL